ncbi:MAG: transcriptional repressor [Dehalococcoidia bacterium]|nr:transcriptional repressor [Dehalococcoidia bacterium]
MNQKLLVDKRKRNNLKLQLIMSRIRNDRNVIKGHPFTSQRRMLLELLQEADGHLDAKTLYRRASARDESISQATVYRNLNLFKELGLIDEMRLDKVRCYYEIKQTSEHQHLICQVCGKVIEFKSPLIKKLIDTLKNKYRFKIDKVELYLEGRCQGCSGK